MPEHTTGTEAALAAIDKAMKIASLTGDEEWEIGLLEVKRLVVRARCKRIIYGTPEMRKAQNERADAESRR
jgi:hypothetical protein